MRGRKPGFFMTEEHRLKIKNSNILNALVEHVEGKREMTATQVTAGVALLRKVMPDLSAVEMSGETVVQHVALPTLPTADEWEQRHATGH
jgi:hypothetical protein